MHPRALPWQAQFVLLASIWGSSFLFIKIGDRSFPPVLLALARSALGAAVLCAWSLAARMPLPRGARAWGHLAVAALCVNTVPFCLYAWAETHVSSVVAGIWNATTPLVALVFVAAFLPAERPGRDRVAGVGVGFLGAAVVVAPWRGLGGGALLGHLAAFGAAACYGLGYPYVRRHLVPLRLPALSLAAGQLLWATAQLAVVAPLSAPPHALRAAPVASVVELGVLGTGLAYVLNYGVVQAAGATIASTVTYVIPLVATALGVAALGEPLGWNVPVGALVVLAGVAVAQGLAPRLRAGAGERRSSSPRTQGDRVSGGYGAD